MIITRYIKIIFNKDKKIITDIVEKNYLFIYS